MSLRNKQAHWAKPNLTMLEWLAMNTVCTFAVWDIAQLWGRFSFGHSAGQSFVLQSMAVLSSQRACVSSLASLYTFSEYGSADCGRQGCFRLVCWDNILFYFKLHLVELFKTRWTMGDIARSIPKWNYDMQYYTRGNAFKISSQWGTPVPSRDRGQLVPRI